MHYKYNDAFSHAIVQAYGTRGVEWLEDLPRRIELCSKLWGLKDLESYPDLTYNYVLAGMMGDVPIVLKLRCDHSAAAREYEALCAYQGYGSVKVLAHDAQLGALILERIIPGKTLASLFPHDDAAATQIAVDCIKKLHRAPIPTDLNFPPLEKVLPSLSNQSEELAPFLVRARNLREKLLATQQEKVFLHGDFHHGNILISRGSEWLVIDPEGIIGDPLCDLAIYMRNPLADLVKSPDAIKLIGNRINTFAAFLKCDKQRLYDWSYVQAVSSAYWSLEDGLDISNHRAFLTLLHEIDFSL